MTSEDGVLELRMRAEFELAKMIECPSCQAAVGTECRSPQVNSPGRIWYHSIRLHVARMREAEKDT